jgi:hypothetical protein
LKLLYQVQTATAPSPGRSVKPPARAFSSHSLAHHQSPHQSPDVVMPAHHINKYLLITKGTSATT